MNDLTLSFETQRLVVRGATPEDAPYIVTLWSDPRVTGFVGFPNGIPTAPADVARRIERGRRTDALLIAEAREGRGSIGQCLVGTPDPEGVCEPDIKLHPSFWGRGYGTELWTALVDQAFLRTSCAVVRGTPNVANAASVRMQERAGMRRVGEGLAEFPASMRRFTVSVPHYIYEITREDWARRAAPR